MAKMVLLASYLSINSNDLSGNTSKIELTAEVADEDVTTFGSGGWKEVLGGLKEGSLSVTFKQDVAASALDSIMWPLFGTVVPFEVRLSNAAVGTSNPKYTGSVLVKEWKPIAGEVGSVAEVDVEFPTSGAVTRATS
jgi:predicted secreted protein